MKGEKWRGNLYAYGWDGSRWEKIKEGQHGVKEESISTADLDFLNLD